MFVDIIQVFIL